VDHLGDQPAPRAPVRRQLHEPDRHYAGGIDQRRRQGRGRRPDQGRPHEARQYQRALVRRGGQPRRLRLHLHRGQPPVAQEPARQQQ
jgi:hypothetical protein